MRIKPGNAGELSEGGRQTSDLFVSNPRFNLVGEGGAQKTNRSTFDGTVLTILQRVSAN